MSDIVYLTRERLREIDEELQHLKNQGRKDMAEMIAEARSHGDLSENAEYDAAKEAQGLLEAKINRLEGIVARTGRLLPKDVWPSLQFLGNWTGGTMGAYLRSYPEFFGDRPVRDIGLIASEG